MKTNRNVHASGALGRLLSKGEVTKVEDNITPQVSDGLRGSIAKTKNAYFKTQSGIEFKENELLYVSPEECEPWKYANRQEAEMHDIQDLMDSISQNQQLQPALVRPHPNPHDKIKYEIIFGRRRHLACSKLDIPFLVIVKDIPDVKDAIATQHAENESRHDVSNYSNAILYKKLLKDGVFKSERELASKLNYSSSSFNDLMSFTKIPHDIVNKIPNIHTLSIAMAVKIAQLLSKYDDAHALLHELAPLLGSTITSPAKLENALKSKQIKIEKIDLPSPQIFISKQGRKLFTLKKDFRGSPCIIFDKEIEHLINVSALCNTLKDQVEDALANATKGQTDK